MSDSDQLGVDHHTVGSSHAVDAGSGMGSHRNAHRLRGALKPPKKLSL